MDDLVGLFAAGRILGEGGGLRQLLEDPNASRLTLGAVALFVMSVIALGLGDCWRETPLARWFGVDPNPHGNWALRARDLNRDGAPDF